MVYSACDFVCKINALVARVVWKMDLLYSFMCFSRMPFLSLSLGVGAKLPSTETSTFLSIRSVSEVENEMSYL